MKIEQIDIFADIIDNYGDMGWVLEFLMESRLPLHLRIVTDDEKQMRSFLERSECILPSHEIVDKNLYDYSSSSPLIILGLHATVDFTRFPLGRGIIRVSYLTFDPWYRDSHEREYILSTPERPIIELVYSPLVSTGGVWHYEKSEVTRKSWLEKMNIESDIQDKIWIPIFTYPETLENLDLENIPEDIHLFFIGQTPSCLSTFPFLHFSTFYPWISRSDFWDLIDLADISVLRGEISSLRGIMSRKPYLWDMYKGVGGWNEDESDAFLEYRDASEKYREIHTKINAGGSWNIEEIISLIDDPSEISLEEIPDFRETLEKTIDKMGFSL